MEKLVFINACIRKENSRTLRLAEELMTALEQRYEITRIDLTEQPMEPVTADLFHRRGTAGISEEDKALGEMVAEANRIVVAAPFWDMSFPAALKCFFEHISFPGITFKNREDGTTCGNCRANKMLYITTRGMDIPTDAPLDQGTPYLRALCWLWGIENLQVVAAWGMDVEDEAVVRQRLAEAAEQGRRICKEF